ncbi:MAG TPA: hypothetical protein VD814_02280, partial [Nocardioides sp.]|nr:hypothetical protein [Nocardioides sp.]
EPKIKCYLEVVVPVGTAAGEDVDAARIAAVGRLDALRADIKAAAGLCRLARSFPPLPLLAIVRDDRVVDRPLAGPFRHELPPRGTPPLPRDSS